MLVAVLCTKTLRSTDIDSRHRQLLRLIAVIQQQRKRTQTDAALSSCVESEL